MDPITAIGAVASIWQIAQAALSLSKTLYTLGSAVGSASEDIQILADDLKTFSQSLTLLSRLLEDSKSWYSDDIYLLTAKIIKDCAELYVKIDKILEKLGSNGKSTWKLRVKFVYKESQIRKLLSRLRDMKGTLATILMSLQVDLQLSLLNISSTSKIQRPPEKPLQPETLLILQEAQKSIMAGGILTKYTVQSENIVQVSEAGVHISKMHSEAHQVGPSKVTAPPISKPSKHLNQAGLSSNLFHATTSFVVVPPNINSISSIIKRDESSTSTIRSISTSERALDDDSPPKNARSPCQDSSPQHPGKEFAASRSLKSSSSVESFKSAMSVQEHDLEIARKVKAVQSVMHAFRTAIQILGNLFERRISATGGELAMAAKELESTLNEGSTEVDRCHMNHFKKHGQVYLQLFDDICSRAIQIISSELMRDVVMRLHEYSAEHEELHTFQFYKLSASTREISLRLIYYLTHLTSKIASDDRLLSDIAYLEPPHSMYLDSLPLPTQVNSQFSGSPYPGDERSKLYRVQSHQNPSMEDVPLMGPQNRRRPPYSPGSPESSLPFIGYTFRRYDGFGYDYPTTQVANDTASGPVPVRDRDRNYEEVDAFTRRHEFLREDFRRDETPPPLVPQGRETKRYSRIIDHQSNYPRIMEAELETPLLDGISRVSRPGQRMAELIANDTSINPIEEPRSVLAPKSMESPSTPIVSSACFTQRPFALQDDGSMQMPMSPVHRSAFDHKSDNEEAGDFFVMKKNRKYKKKDKKKNRVILEETEEDILPIPLGFTSVPSNPEFQLHNVKEIESGPKLISDGIAAGSDDDQLSLERQLQEEFDYDLPKKLSKKDRKPKRPLVTPARQASRSIDVDESTEDRHRAPVPLIMKHGSRSGATPTTGEQQSVYSADQLELARQLEEEFGPVTKKSKKKEKRKRFLDWSETVEELTEDHDRTRSLSITPSASRSSMSPGISERQSAHDGEYRGRKVLAGAALGAIGAELITRARSRDRESREDESAQQLELSRRSEEDFGTSSKRFKAENYTPPLEDSEQSYQHLKQENSPQATNLNSDKASRTDAIRETTELQEYQKQLLATVPSYTEDHKTHMPYSQPIELSPAQIKQQKQALREYKLALMPGHDPDSKETNDAYDKVLQDYQTSLMTLECGRDNNRSLEMSRIRPEDSPRAVDKLNSAQDPFMDTFPLGEIQFAASGSANMDILQDFDFDSFLHQNPQDGECFDFETVVDSKPEDNTHPVLTSNDEITNQDADSMQVDETAQQDNQAPSSLSQPVPAWGEGPTGQDSVLYVNSKQFYRILKRRGARKQLAERLAKQKSKTPESSIAGRWAINNHDSKTKEKDAEQAEISNNNINDGMLQYSSTTLPLRPAHSTMLVNTDNEQVELAWSFPALSPTQTSKLWWQAYISLISSSSAESPVFTTVKNSLESELGILASRHLSDDTICRRISNQVRRLGTALHHDKPQMEDALETRSNILRILTTIDDQLGLEIATLGWSCVCVLLSLYEKTIASFASNHVPGNFLKTSYSHLEDIVAIIARYAVMENLYQQSGGALSLKPEYRSALISLCSTILEYFAAAFELAHTEGTRENGSEEELQKCTFLVELIRQKDAACQGFKVVVDTKEESSDESESESEEVEVEDVSDADWERIECGDVGLDV
ncbi:hypothetical protein EG329_004954 [Mollisiaceae sp. DMI_Dod_QoI]|nr:hypothetical protein EG329_004954 [Helotiales sp. DMI_Dod_QoI]